MYGQGFERGRTYAIGLMAAALILAGSGVAVAQPIPDTGGRVFGLIGGSFGDGGTTVMTAGGAGLRLTRQLGLDFEVMHIPELDMSDDDEFVIQRARPYVAIFPPITFDRDGSLTTFLTRFTVDFPVAGNRLIPFVSAGGGIGHLSQRTESRFDRDIPIAEPLLNSANSASTRLIFPRPVFDRSETGLALTVGGGVDVRLWRGLGVGADVRWLRLLGELEDLDVANVVARVSYRF